MKYTQVQMETAINEWQQSGLSKKEFCRQKNIACPTFHYWCKRLGSASSSGFAQISVVNQQRSGGFEIVFASGTRITFQGEPSVNWLRELVG